MMKKFLTLKHWQLFLLFVGLPVLFQIVSFVLLRPGDNPRAMLFWFPLMLMFFMVVFLFGWFYALGTNLHKKLPASTTMNVRRFKVFLFIPVLYMLFISVFTVSLFLKFWTEGPPAMVFAFIVPAHLFSIFCIFYCLYFVARALKTVEAQKPVTFSDYAGEFFLIWFFPIGVWLIQPRINKLFSTDINHDNLQVIDDNVY